MILLICMFSFLDLLLNPFFGKKLCSLCSLVKSTVNLRNWFGTLKLFLPVKLFNIPNVLTALNMVCGALAILLSLTGFVHWAPALLFTAAVLDFFDGFVARLLHQQGELGKQLDSLADVISFGLAPGIFMFVVLIQVGFRGEVEMLPGDASYLNDWVRGIIEGSQSNWLPLVALLIPFFSLFRLAKFNIDTRQTTSFIGLPTPANTIFFSVYPLTLVEAINTPEGVNGLVDAAYHPVTIIGLVIFMSFFLVAEIPLFALKFKEFGWKGNEVRFVFLGASIVLIPLLAVWSIPIIVLLYIVLSMLENFVLKR